MKCEQFNKKMFQLPRWLKRLVMVCVDLLIIPFAVWVSFALQFATWQPPITEGIWFFIVAPLISIPFFIRLGLYRSVIRFLGGKVLSAVVAGVTVSVVALLLLTFFIDTRQIPYTIFIIYWGTVLLLIGASRYVVRRVYHQVSNASGRINVAIYGAGISGAQLTQALLNSTEFRPVLFIDDDLALQKSLVHGLKVYSPSQLAYLINRFQIKQLLLAMPSIELNQRREILCKLGHLSIHVRTIPSTTDLVSGSSIVELREIGIDDLLGRESVVAHQDLLSKSITDKRVLVTGAGGSIGSELCRQIILQSPKKLVLFEISEFALYQIEIELLKLCFGEERIPEIVPVLGSVQNQVRVSETLVEHQIQTLYHAADYKHVPLVERNPVEGMQNNALGAFRTALAAFEANVERFVLISTDKAVRPTNVMGASKRMAELSLQALAQRSGKTVFTMVRFGTVLDSSGSVVPLFRSQIQAGGPITVTHPDIIRYFMTIPEAAQLVIQAGTMAKGGEVFLLDMGKPVKIVDMAKRMISLSGLTEKTLQWPEGDIAIEYTGLRPGEKLYEELLIEGDSSSTAHPRIFQAHEESVTWDEYGIILDNLNTACNRRDVERIYSMLKTYVTGYKVNHGNRSTRQNKPEPALFKLI